MHLMTAKSWMRCLFLVRKRRWWPILHCILWISQCVFEWIKSVLAWTQWVQAATVQTWIWYPFISAEGFRSKLFFSPAGLQHNKHKQHTEADLRFFSIMKHHENIFTSWLWCLSLETMILFRTQWATIPSLDAADPAYGAAWSSERWSNAVSPIFGGRWWCRFSNLQTKSKTGTRFIDDWGVSCPSALLQRPEINCWWVEWAESAYRISFITRRPQHQGCLHYVSVMGRWGRIIWKKLLLQRKVSSVSLCYEESSTS